MKKKNLATILAFILISCNQQNLIEENQSYTKISSRGNSPHLIYNTLGWGYDITGDYMSHKSIKYPVIDINKFDTEHPNGISQYDPYERDESYYYGENSKEYLKNITANSKFGNSDTTYLTGTITNNFTNKVSYSSQYSWACLEKKNILRHVWFVQNHKTLSNYLTNEFLNDLSNSSCNYIINKYGTHVLTDICLGGKLSLLYRSFAMDSRKEETTRSGFETLLHSFSLSSSYEINQTLVNKNKERYLICETIGGTGGIISKIDIEKGLPEIDINNWDATVNIASAGVIDINWDKLIPIYELVADSEKKNLLKKATEAYIANARLELLTPLFRYFSNGWKDHLYTTDITELGYDNRNYTYEGIEGYVYSEKKNDTEPLYRYFCDSRKDHLYTTDIKELGLYDKNYKYEGIQCYVLNKQLSGSVPMRRYYNKDWKDHIYISGKLGDSLGSNWQAEGIAFYVYK